MSQATMTQTARGRHLHPNWGPAALVGAALIALTVTIAAATVQPGLAQSGKDAYRLSGVAMTVSDLLVLLGIVALAATTAVRAGRLKTVGFAVAIAGSSGVVVAEVLLRVSHSTGTALFGVVGPIQAIGFILVGLGVVVTHNWRGWHRYMPLLLGVYIPAVLVPALATSKGDNLIALGGYHTIILLVGVAYLRQLQRSSVSR